MNRDGSDSDKNSLIRSSKDYWEDIEPKLNQHAKLLDFSSTVHAHKQLDNADFPSLNTPGPSAHKEVKDKHQCPMAKSQDRKKDAKKSKR